MGLEAATHHPNYCLVPPAKKRTTNSSMSQGFHHQGILSFSSPDGFEQNRRDKLIRGQGGFDPSGIEDVDEEVHGGPDPGIYDVVHPGAGNMLSDMFNFHPSSSTGPPPAADLLPNLISASYRPFPPARPMPGFSGDWYGASRSMVGDPTSSTAGKQQGDHDQLMMQGLTADSAAAAAMHLFLMNPPQQQQQHGTSPPSPPQAVPAALHQQQQHAFHAAASVSFNDSFTPAGVVPGEGHGLSLSISSSRQPFEMARELSLSYFNTNNNQQRHEQVVGYGGGPVGVVNVLRNSRYARVVQELLEELCSVGRGHLSRVGRNPKPTTSGGGGGGGGGSSSAAGPTSSSASKEPPPMSPAERFEQQRKKAKLLSMLDEVDTRYNHYCEQMQMVVNSFDSVMGFGAATPYTALAQKAMSRHFRCLKDAIAAQLKQTCELLGDKDGASSSGITKGETPRLRLLDQSLRQQRAFHQMGMMEQEPWRPQRGLPERSVNILRAWLFEHFLHPYPSDADKHLLARQTGLSRNQVSNWFINARVRLWKPMVEEMYQQESKDREGDDQRAPSPTHHHHHHLQQQQSQRAESNASESDLYQTHHRFASNIPQQPQQSMPGDTGAILPGISTPELCGPSDDMYQHAGAGDYAAAATEAQIRLAATGDVSLTLGLRHAGNAPDKCRFKIRDFGG